MNKQSNRLEVFNEKGGSLIILEDLTPEELINTQKVYKKRGFKIVPDIEKDILTDPKTNKRWVFRKDDDCHNFLIPLQLSERFSYLLENSLNEKHDYGTRIMIMTKLLKPSL